MTRSRRISAAWTAALLAAAASLHAAGIDPGEVLAQMRDRGLLGAQAKTWDQAQWDLLWRMRKAEADGAADLLTRRAPDYKRLLVEVWTEYPGFRGYRVYLNAAGYTRYRFLESQDAIRAFEAAGVPLKDVFHLTDMAARPFFDAGGALTDPGDDAYQALSRGDAPRWRFDWEPLPPPPDTLQQAPDPPEVAALKAAGLEELDPEEELWLTRVTICSDEQLEARGSLRIVRGRTRSEPRYFMSPSDPLFALIGRHRAGDRGMMSATGTASFGQGRGSLCR